MREAGLAVVVGLVLVLLMSLSGLEYNEVGLLHNVINHKVDRTRVWPMGLHLVGPFRAFVTFPIETRTIEFNRITVFSKNDGSNSAGTILSLDASIQYRLRPDEVGRLHAKVGQRYEPLIQTWAVEAIKNTAPYFSLTNYLEHRSMVAKAMWANCTKALIQANTDITGFQLRSVTFPEKVENLFVSAAIQRETNDRTWFEQQAAVVRANTEVERQQIMNKADLIIERSRALAQFLQQNASATASRMESKAREAGMVAMFEQLGIDTLHDRTEMDHLLRLNTRLSTSNDNVYVGFSSANAFLPS